jgi:hypothetical protein
MKTQGGIHVIFVAPPASHTRQIACMHHVGPVTHKTLRHGLSHVCLNPPLAIDISEMNLVPERDNDLPSLGLHRKEQNRGIYRQQGDHMNLLFFFKTRKVG